jgi:hypothetical protein
MIDGLKNSKNSHITQINDKKVILDIDSGKYYLLNNIGALVWDFIQSDTNLSLEEVSDQLAKNFDQKKEVISKEIQDFIESISKFGLIS